LVPLALSALLVFMLAPVVTKLQRWVGRTVAVLLVVAMIFAGAGAIGWVLTRQAVDFANNLPSYKENIQSKLRSIRTSSAEPFSKLSTTIEELKKELPGAAQEGKPGALNGANSTETKATPVEIVKAEDQGLLFMQGVLAPALGPLGTAALVLILVIFMLLEREELRNRIIRLIGQGRISTTAHAMDDAGTRVSKYLLMQLVVNVTYGIPVAIGLYFIGVPNAMLWGVLAAVLRFIPYLGPWIAAAFPIGLSLATSPGWMAPLLTIGLFVVLELVSNNVMEPLLYGNGIGITPIALIIAALVWTTLWGPVGLVLATPLTACLVVMGRHIPRLAFLSIALSDEDALTPAQDCYQRLLRSGDHDEMELVDQFLKTNPPVALFDSVLIPVLTAAGTDYRLGLLQTGELESVELGMSNILDALAPDSAPAEELDFRICCVPAREHRGQLAGNMLEQLLRSQGYPAQSTAAKMPFNALVSLVTTDHIDLVCISAVAPTTVVHARYLCAKLRVSSPTLKIMVGLWGRPELDPTSVQSLRDAGADAIVATLAEAIAWVANATATAGARPGSSATPQLEEIHSESPAIPLA
jgi:predicted PurR-regulated permease PerM/methanogenic corrinoid protein MtbC1